MITANKKIVVTVDIQNATAVAKARSGWLKRFALIFLPNSSIKSGVEAKVNEVIREKLDNDLARQVEQAIRDELAAQGIEATVQVE